ncbi:MAG: cyclic-di-AMP receptor [Chloroflexi bacterium]|nr:cyclic-di-AMP receptor [Chloroflexota bacterium]MDA1145486.1 cyclic-di-AMP receptor [Chloroflexota bacterium]
MKLCVVIVPGADGDRLLDRLAEAQFGATKVGSSGGFLRRGNVTAFVAVEDDQVADLMALLHEHFPAMTEPVSRSSLPLADESGQQADMLDVRTGGAVAFVLGLERSERM